MTEPKFKEGDEVIWNIRSNKIITIVKVEFTTRWLYWNDCHDSASHFDDNYVSEGRLRKITKLDKVLI